jgi:hypothetical protein
MAVREAKIEEELYRLFVNVLEKNSYALEGVKFGEVEPQFRINGGKADLMIPVQPDKPLIIIECKRKVEKPGGMAYHRNFDPMSSRVIIQALNYAVLSGAPLFATTNGNVFALFTKPERDEPFRIDRHRLFIREIQQLNEGAVQEILSIIARWKIGLTITKTPVDWAFIVRLRSFVQYLSRHIFPIVEQRLRVDKAFKERFDAFSIEVGGTTSGIYSREAAYIIMNKLVFYKVLERYYGGLSKMKPIDESEGRKFQNVLQRYFEEAMRVTNDFEPVFSAGIYDEVPLPDEQIVLDEINSFIEDMGTYKLEEVSSDIMGFIYEHLIPPIERHNLGQFYTPPQIAEFIGKWAIRADSDVILDPACGSGTFLVKAYGILKSMKPLQGATAHREILGQIFGIDINPFPAHLTAVNLAMRDVKNPTSEMNIIVEDFFNTAPLQRMIAPFATKTVRGPERREIVLPEVDAVIANPPYTRWTEMNELTRKAVSEKIGAILSKYRLRPGAVKSEPMIFVHFVMYASEFLKQEGRLGMIISNSWLQTGYGINFAEYLLDNFKVKAVIDFATRLFSIPIVATNVILLEKCESEKERLSNRTVFIYADKEVTVEGLLDAVERPSRTKKEYQANVVTQAELPKDAKWIGVFFGIDSVFAGIDTTKYFVKMADLFHIRKGNTGWAAWAITHGSRLDLGANNFFFLHEEEVDHWGLNKFAKPALSTPLDSRFYTFTEGDWDLIRKKEGRCYIFMCHEKRQNLTESIKRYLRWGEAGCETRHGKCSESDSCQAREKEGSTFNGWYDLGGFENSLIISPYYQRYRPRFLQMKYQVVHAHDFLTFLPKSQLDELEVKALLAYLNSTFNQLYIETQGRVPGGVGPIALEILQAETMPVLDVRKLGKKNLKLLAALFDELDDVSRTTKGANIAGNIDILNPTFEKIDATIAKIIGLSPSKIKHVKDVVDMLVQRRLKGREARPEIVVGEEKQRIKIPRKSRPQKNDDPSAQLDRWIN